MARTPEWATSGRWTEEMARDALRALDRSGKPLRVFAAREGVTAQRLERWRRRLRDDDLDDVTEFIELRPPASGDGGVLEVVIGGQRVIRVPQDFDAATLRRLVTVLEERC